MGKACFSSGTWFWSEVCPIERKSRSQRRRGEEVGGRSKSGCWGTTEYAMHAQRCKSGGRGEIVQSDASRKKRGGKQHHEKGHPKRGKEVKTGRLGNPNLTTGIPCGSEATHRRWGGNTSSMHTCQFSVRANREEKGKETGKGEGKPRMATNEARIQTQQGIRRRQRKKILLI